MIMGKYHILLNVLDKLRQEAPGSYKRYYPPESDVEKLNYARSLAFIHLFLKANYDLSTFAERENLITDGPGDAGVDAYYIDEENKKIIFIQSKFRATEKNFEIKEIVIDEILSMQASRIIDGETHDENGNPYNDKVQKMIKSIHAIPDMGRYKYEVVILANLTKYKLSDINKIAGLPTTVINYDISYSKLLFPVLTGCCHVADEIIINLSLLDKSSDGGKISYSIQTEYTQCNVMVVFVPTLEIAKILDKYKNSILRYNPRCYLGLAQNEVNPQIENTIKNKSTNEFALFNNGITILSDKTELNEHIAVKGKAQIIISNPQIINGGQTAYTLANLYRHIFDSPEAGESLDIFDNKEVLVKIVTFLPEEVPDAGLKLQLIENLSKATNQQSQVEEADRRANDKVQINYQEKIFKDFGFCYNRKRGEFFDGTKNFYITSSQIIDRSIFIRIAASINNYVSIARRSSDKIFFSDKYFQKLFPDGDEYKKYMYGYFCYMYLSKLEKNFLNQPNNKYGINTYGNALRYGKYAVVNIVSKIYSDNIDIFEYERHAIKATDDVLIRWLDFEKHVSEQTYNDYYFYDSVDERGEVTRYANFDGYYKGRNVDYDLEQFADRLFAVV